MPELLLGQVVYLLVVKTSLAYHEICFEIVILLRDTQPGVPDGVPQQGVAWAGDDQDQQSGGWTGEQRQILNFISLY